MADSPHYLLVGNPTARSGKALGRIDKALASLRRRGVSASFMPTRPDGRTVRAVFEAIDNTRVDTVISLGGDGTFAEVAKGVLAAGRRVPMAFIPSGTANDQGRSFGISASPDAIEENLDIVLEGHQIRLDVGRIQAVDESGHTTHRDLFFDSAGFGLQPDILWRRNRDRGIVGQVPVLRRLYTNQAVYAGATVQEVLRTVVDPVKFTAEVTTPDGTTTRFKGLTDLVVNATPVYGGWWVPTPHTETSDGLMELMGIAGRRDMLMTSIKNIQEVGIPIPDSQLLGSPAVREIQDRAFDIELYRPRGDDDITSQVDGEEWVRGNHFRVEVWAGALPLIIRKGWTPPWKAEGGG